MPINPNDPNDDDIAQAARMQALAQMSDINSGQNSPAQPQPIQPLPIQAPLSGQAAPLSFNQQLNPADISSLNQASAKSHSDMLAATARAENEARANNDLEEKENARKAALGWGGLSNSLAGSVSNLGN